MLTFTLQSIFNLWLSSRQGGGTRWRYEGFWVWKWFSLHFFSSVPSEMNSVWLIICPSGWNFISLTLISAGKLHCFPDAHTRPCKVTHWEPPSLSNIQLCSLFCLNLVVFMVFICLYCFKVVVFEFNLTWTEAAQRISLFMFYWLEKLFFFQTIFKGFLKKVLSCY